jgi:hypothetical protein
MSMPMKEACTIFSNWFEVRRHFRRAYTIVLVFRHDAYTMDLQGRGVKFSGDNVS